MFKFRRTTKPEDLDKKLVLSLVQNRLPSWKQFRLFPTLLNPRERWIMRAASGLLIIACAILLTNFLKRHIVQIPRDGGIYREGLVGSPRLINPILGTSDTDRDIARLIYAGLLRYNGEGILEGDLAEHFTIEDAGREVRFTLRNNAVFHDGEPVRASDVVFTIEAIRNQAWRSPLWRSFQDVTIESPDEHTVIAKSKAVLPSFPSLFTVGILPKHIWAGIDPQIADRAVWNLKPIGAGPYQFNSLAKSRDGEIVSYKLTRASRYHHGNPYLKEIVLELFPDFESALDAVKSHTTDGMSFVPERLRAKVSTSDLRMYRASFPRATGLFFQDRRSEFLRESAVRKALQYAIDRSAIAALVPQSIPTVLPFFEGQIGYTKSVAIPQQNQDAARAELKGAGWTSQDGGWVKNNKRLTLTLTTLDEPIHLQVVSAIKQSWEQIGIGVRLEAAPRVTFEREVLRPRAYEVLLFSILSNNDPDPYVFWHSSQIDDPGLNLGSIRVRAIDSLLEQGRATIDPRARGRAYLEFGQRFQEEIPAILLYSSSYAYAVRTRIHGIHLTAIATPADRFNMIYQWYTRSRLGWK